jgi:hypothetical protein
MHKLLMPVHKWSELLQLSIFQEAAETFIPDVWKPVIGVIKYYILDILY